MSEVQKRLLAADVALGVSRLLLRNDQLAVPEVSLGNGRRADLFALCPKGLITIIEIKVSRADLLGDGKWPDYLDYCDRYFWAVPSGFDLGLFDRAELLPERAGLMVADRYDAVVVREASLHPLNAARRKSETLAVARRAARRLLVVAGIPDDSMM